MIQRIQSAYLLLAAIAVMALLVVPGLAVPDGWSWYTPVKVAASILIAVGCLVAIFMYTDRIRQRGLVTVNLWLAIALAATLIASVPIAGMVVLAAIWPNLLAIAATILLLLARRAITKDIELVRSMDRLR
jgi:hypothetical protein